MAKQVKAKKEAVEEVEIPSVKFNDFIAVRDFCKNNGFSHPVPVKSYDMELNKGNFKYFNKYYKAVLGKNLSIEFAKKMFNLSRLG